jgi:mRNA-degrading endonuclease YafQ of YafQ-DinJ toxin-antitoxin module
MPITLIKFSSHFKKAFNKLPLPIQEKFAFCRGIFLLNPFDPRLKTHKLHGAKQNFWSFSINYNYRVIFQFLDDHTVVFLKVDTHEIY